jgi:transcriptional regulator with XRE-family HTH domain
LPYREIAVAADLSERRIQQIEQGKNSNVNLNVAKAIAKRLGVKLEDLV